MRLAELRVFLETSPAIKLLRSPNAAFIVDFLDQHFKRAGKLAINQSDLHAALLAYRESIQDGFPDALRDKADSYLVGWCSAETRWLHRFLEAGCDEPMFQLTPHTESVLAFLDRVVDNELGFVGTESRLRIVIDTLADLTVHAFDDPERRLLHLRSEKAKIEQEVEWIENKGQVSRYQPAQIRERFANAVSTLRQLQGDFRAVEDKFKDITLHVQHRQAAGNDTRGGILEFALESEDVLKREDQGVSFYEFVRFILSPSQQEKLRAIIDDLGRIQEVAEQADGLEAVRRMVPMLLDEAEKVMRTNQRLSSTLRRLLDRRAYQDRQRVAGLLREIKQLAASQGDTIEVGVGIEVDTNVEISSPMTRAFWSEPQRFAPIELSENIADDALRLEAFRDLAQMKRLDWRTMRRHVQEILSRRGTAKLSEVLAEYPPSAGVVEIVGYLQIARDDGHMIDPDVLDHVVIPGPVDGQAREVSMPLVLFVS